MCASRAALILCEWHSPGHEMQGMKLWYVQRENNFNQTAVTFGNVKDEGEAGAWRIAEITDEGTNRPILHINFHYSNLESERNSAKKLEKVSAGLWRDYIYGEVLIVTGYGSEIDNCKVQCGALYEQDGLNSLVPGFGDLVLD